LGGLPIARSLGSRVLLAVNMVGPSGGTCGPLLSLAGLRWGLHRQPGSGTPERRGRNRQTSGAWASPVLLLTACEALPSGTPRLVSAAAPLAPCRLLWAEPCCWRSERAASAVIAIITMLVSVTLSPQLQHVDWPRATPRRSSATAATSVRPQRPLRPGRQERCRRGDLSVLRPFARLLRPWHVIGGNSQAWFRRPSSSTSRRFRRIS